MRLNHINKHLIHVPMTHFTPNELKPSEKTLCLIRQIAYSYKVFENTDKPGRLCLS